ncbi:MAG: cytidine/deoxycytidylate deaminase family protein [bacterium]
MQTPFKRPSWDEYFMKITEIVGSRGTCDRGRSGCVITKEKRIISTGYVGSPINTMHCDEAGHEMHTVTHPDGSQSRHCIRTTHAEQNAICQAARTGIALGGATLYCKMTPCYTCAKMIINSGIARVVCDNDYHAGKRSKEIFAEAGVQFKLLNSETITYADMKPEAKINIKISETLNQIKDTAVPVKVISNSQLTENDNLVSAEIPL